MKKILWTCLASTALLSARAQLFSPEAFGGAALGAMIGGIAGGNTYSHGCHSYSTFSGEGAAIGAGVGLLVGALAGEANRRQAYPAEPVAYVPASSVSVGYGYAPGGRAGYVQVAPGYAPPPAYAYPPARPNYAVGGTLLGAASGALIGEGTQGKPGGGAAIGAAAGLVLGGLAEHAARKREQRLAAAQPAAQTQYPPPAPSPTQDPGPQTFDSRSGITSQPGATSTYYWTAAPPQIADAARVPDAPRF